VDEDFDTASFDEAYDPSDFAGESFNINMGDPSEGDEDYRITSADGQQVFDFPGVSPQSYMEFRGATPTNPFPESIFSKIFGAENVDYRDILGTGGIAGVENLRFRQGMGMPSLRTGKPFEMGDFYVGQPTLEGEVKELPQGGILGLIEQVIPGISTLSKIFGRNRGLPESSQAYQDKLKEIQENQDNIMQSFKPITDFVGDLRTAGGDLIDRFSSGIGSLERRFRDAITPRNMTDQGVSSLNQRQATEADENVAEALQLVPQVRNFSFTPVDKQFLNRQPVDPRLLNQLDLINQNRENQMRAQLGV